MGTFTEEDIIMTGWAGLNGSVILADRYHDKLCKKIPEAVLNRADIINCSDNADKAAEISKRFNAECFKVSEGGILKALWDMSVSIDKGIQVWLSQINIRQETIEICEYFNINPYMLNGEGSIIIVSDKGNIIVRELNASGIKAGVIGYTCKNNDKVVISGDVRSHIQSRIKDELDKYL